MIKFRLKQSGYAYTDICTFDFRGYIITHRCPVCGYVNPWHSPVNPKRFSSDAQTTCDKCHAVHYLGRTHLTLSPEGIIEALVAPEGAEIIG